MLNRFASLLITATLCLNYPLSPACLRARRRSLLIYQTLVTTLHLISGNHRLVKIGPRRINRFALRLN